MNFFVMTLLNQEIHEKDLFKFVGQKFKGDREIALKAVKKNGSSLQSLSEFLKNDIEIL
jgi:hypothetical protein